MATEYEDSSSIIEKLTLIVFIAAIAIGNICVFVTYIVRADRKHWSNVFVLSISFIDLFIGSFILPMRFISAYGNPLTSKQCTALSIGESFVIAFGIYSILFMVYTRLYDLKRLSITIQRRYLIILIITLWIIFFLLYLIPYTINNSVYLLTISSSSNTTSYCTTYTISVYHPLWMSYIEIGIIYTIPFLFIFFGLCFLMKSLCQMRSKGFDLIERKYYHEQKKMTWHVLILSLTLMLLWSPWMITRIIIIFQNTKQIQQILQITYYILIFKSVLFPILYASTNSSFRGSFAIYRHKRIIPNNRIWTTNEHY